MSIEDRVKALEDEIRAQRRWAVTNWALWIAAMIIIGCLGVDALLQSLRIDSLM